MTTKEFVRTKIVCTIGPASNTDEQLMQMIEAGMDIARINFSHSRPEDHAHIISRIRKLSDDIAILVDLSGPKFRIGEVKAPFELKTGDRFVITSEDILGDSSRVTINHKLLPKEVKPGNRLWINDGLVGLQVEKIEHAQDIITTCITGGPISSKKGVNAPDVPLSVYFPTTKDLQDAEFILNFDPDFFAASFIRRAEDITPLRELIEKKYKQTKIIAKIEHPDALQHIDAIIAASDGIMVARGDLGLEIPIEDVPVVQKNLIRRCNEKAKPVITATQMLESMTASKRPTRAEASDVCNAVLDGSDAVMLSGETATGKYPVESLVVMNRIAHRAEKLLFENNITNLAKKDQYTANNIPDALAYSACHTTSHLKIAAILAVTRSGSTARAIAKYRPRVPIISATSSKSTFRQLQLTWGVIPILIDVKTSTDEIVLHSIEIAVAHGLISETDHILLVGGSLLGTPAKTNFLQALLVQDVLEIGETKKNHRY